MISICPPGLSAPEPLSIAHGKLAALYRLWQARRGERALPSRSDFSFEDLGAWMGNLGILEVEPAPLRFRFRLYGTRLVEFDDCDFTGRYLDDVLTVEWRDRVIAHYRRCTEEARPVYTIGASGRKDWLTIHRLLLPCSTDGSSVDRIIVGLYPENPGRQSNRPSGRPGRSV